MSKLLMVLLSSLLLWSVNSYAEEKAEIKAENLRVILAPSVARSTAAYGEIKNTGDVADTLIGISSNVGMAMLHQTKITSGSAQMNHIEEYTIKPRESLVLKPMSYHIMFTNIDHDVVKQDGKATITLTFKNAGDIKFTVPIASD